MAGGGDELECGWSRGWGGVMKINWLGKEERKLASQGSREIKRMHVLYSGLSHLATFIRVLEKLSKLLKFTPWVSG